MVEKAVAKAIEFATMREDLTASALGLRTGDLFGQLVELPMKIFDTLVFRQFAAAGLPLCVEPRDESTFAHFHGWR
jgi:hypothetical protein